MKDDRLKGLRDCYLASQMILGIIVTGVLAVNLVKAVVKDWVL